MIMNKWNNIPNEILKTIVQNTPHTPNPHWMYVNRQWLNVYQAISFNAISVRLKPSDKTLHNILYSLFEPGRWVKKVRIRVIDTPPDNSQIDPSTDSLSNLMQRCPYVNQVHLVEANDQHWAYFRNVLLSKSHDSWDRIRYLEPSFCKDDTLIYSMYLDCALHLKKTLVALSLKQVTIYSSRRLQFFTGFESLTTLTIMDGNFLTSKFDREILIQNLPSCTSSLTVINAQSTAHDFHATGTTRVSDNATTIFSNIKELTIINFDTQSDNAFLQLIHEFPHLCKLTLTTNEDMNFYVAIHPFTGKDKVGVHILNAFFDYIHAIASVELVLGFYNTDMFLQHYYNYHNSKIDQGKASVINEVSFQQTLPRDTIISQDVSPQAFSSNDISAHKVEINIEDGQTKVEAYFWKEFDVWQLENRVIEEILFYGIRSELFRPTIDLGRMLASHQHLRRLTLQDGPFLLELPDTTDHVQSTVQYLELLNVIGVNPTAIASMFRYLKILHLSYTDYFLRMGCWIYRILCWPPTLAIRVHAKEKGKVRYLACNLQTQYEIDYARFESLNESPHVVVLGVTFKSIRKFIFSRSRIYKVDHEVVVYF
ncbi:uncharacterized protein EV154DRAFT_573293 [Mucor mucedo]|uniref:uncharacterized protein n=1 Tax=Mucor mucedo TaxID=29922 RepID=UPI002220B997|nr:uncharacterized protein EV154DRAFT_573293 [Mucor mucedo]KAI7895481.1 hypothetical protein EV154DRAFT_573293 [Mucor mucedo]